MTRFLTALAGLVATVGVAHADVGSANLMGVTGKVLINSGNGFQAVEPATAVTAGSEIFVAANASAILHFNTANCDVVLAAASVTRVTGPEMCQRAMLAPVAPNGLRGSAEDVVITPTNGSYGMAGAPVVAGELPPLAIAGAIFSISAAAFTQSYLESDPVSGP